MRAVVQRAREASVEVDGVVVGQLPRPGLLVLLGVTHDDTAATADRLAEKLWTLRILDGEREVRIFKRPVPVRCRVERVGGFSAHADWKEVLRWLEGMPSAPRRSFTTHGEPEAAAAMAEHIRERYGWRVDAPQYGERVELE